MTVTDIVTCAAPRESRFPRYRAARIRSPYPEVLLMRVFITGASGWIGSAVVPELIGAGHQVVGLARSDASADALAEAGAEVRRGTLDDLDTLRSAAADADGVIHLAFKHDIAFSGGFEDAAEADRRAIDTFGEALTGSDRPSSSPPAHSGWRRDGSRPSRTARSPARSVPTWPAARPSGWPTLTRRSPSRTAASTRRSSGSLPPFTATGTTGSSPPWSPSPAKRASPAT